MRKQSASKFFPPLFLMIATQVSCVFLVPLKADRGIVGTSLESGETVAILNGSVISFEPGQKKDTGFIFYPGARVEAEAYAATSRAVAEAGFPSYIVRMPFNFAIFDSNAALKVIKAHPETKRWVVSGHSLGGAMACAFAGKNPDKISGLVLFAAYPGGGTDLSAYPIPVLSISGELDGLATKAKIDAAKGLLPASAEYLVLTGGNHARFGSYGKQEGDNEATMSAEEQLRAASEATVRFLKTVEDAR